MPYATPSDSPAPQMIPGQWFIRLHHSALRAVHDFSCVNEPTVEFNSAGTALTVTVDENTIILPVDGLRIVWKFLVPADHELPLAVAAA